MLKGRGWHPSLPDFRDYTMDTPAVASLLSKKGPRGAAVDLAGVPEWDLRPWCPPVDDQGAIGSCTAHAGVGVYRYFLVRVHGHDQPLSRLFLYKTTRRLGRYTGDSGAELRNMMGALVLFGAPPEEHWPYEPARFDEEPPAFCYAFGQSFQATKYFRLDTPGTTRDDLLLRLKIQLINGLPAVFGFTCYSSLDGTDAAKGLIPFPARGEKITGGHAVVAVGYNDRIECKNATPGALLIRNSWGTSWGDGGYGWLPYDYVTRGLAEDFWCLIRAEWIDLEAFA